MYIYITCNYITYFKENYERPHNNTIKSISTAKYVMIFCNMRLRL